MKVDGYASHPHYLDHLAPVWHALPDHARGRLWIKPSRRMGAQAARLRLDIQWGQPPQSRRPMLVAGGSDIQYGQHVILLEHGAGQTYVGLDHQSWAGGAGRERVRLFLVPNVRVAAANRVRYPTVPNVVVGSPHVEALAQLPWDPAGANVRVVFSRHWDGTTLEEKIPELRSGWRYFHDAIAAYADAHRGTVAFHAHPRCAPFMAAEAAKLDVPFIDHFDDAVRWGDCYVADNTSTLFEWAALGRPVVLLDAPWYRRNVEQGLRFWSHANIGFRCSNPDALPSTISAALLDPSMIRRRRERLIRDVFPWVEGASRRAADAIVECSDG